MRFIIGFIIVTAVSFGCAELALRSSEAEECNRLERQLQGGYIKTLPEWCQEVQGR